jgi:hypothetical protein
LALKRPTIWISPSLKNYRDHALSLAYDLKVKNDEVNVGHARLLEDHAKLEKEFKAFESKFSVLAKYHAQLQDQLRELARIPLMTMVANASLLILVVSMHLLLRRTLG